MNWKLNRLLNWYAWKYWFNFLNICVVLVIIITFWIERTVEIPPAFMTIIWILYSLILIYITIDSVCSPQEEISDTICVYKEGKNRFVIVVKNGKSRTSLWVKEYEWFLVGNRPADICIVYRWYNNLWYRKLGTNKSILLGKRLNKILFSILLDHNEIRYTVVSPQGMQQIQGIQSYQRVYLPPEVKIRTSKDFSLASLIQVPDEILLVKNGKNYATYGFYISLKKTPMYKKIYIDYLSFYNGSEWIGICWKPKEQAYREFVRSPKKYEFFNALYDFGIGAHEQYHRERVSIKWNKRQEPTQLVSDYVIQDV